MVKNTPRRKITLKSEEKTHQAIVFQNISQSNPTLAINSPEHTHDDALKIGIGHLVIIKFDFASGRAPDKFHTGGCDGEGLQVARRWYRVIVYQRYGHGGCQKNKMKEMTHKKRKINIYIKAI